MSGARTPASTLTPDVSVIVSAWNDAKWLPAFMDAVLSQDHENFELLIVDDGSTDDTFEILNSYKDPRIRISRNEERRYWINVMNDLADRGKGRIIKPMCPDDLMRPHCISTIVSFHGTYPDLGYSFSSFDYIDRLGSPTGGSYEVDVPTRVSPMRANNYFMERGCYLNVSTMSIPRAAWMRDGRFRDLCTRNPRHLPLAPDFELAARLSADYTAGYIAEPLIEVRTHPATLTDDLAIKGLQFEARLRVLQAVAAWLDATVTDLPDKGTQQFRRRAAGVVNLGVYYVATGHVRCGLSIISAVCHILPPWQAASAWIGHMRSKLSGY